MLLAGARSQIYLDGETREVHPHYNVSCYGNETSITECQYETTMITNCSDQYAGVYCSLDTARKSEIE